MESSSILAELTLSGSSQVIRPACSFVRELALQEGFSEEDAHKLELVAEEACHNVLKHALKGSRDRFYILRMENRPGQFVLAIQDHGEPIDWKKAESEEKSHFGMHLFKSCTDQVRCINLGKDGKRIEFIKNFMPHAKHGNSHIEGEEYETEDAEKMAPLDIPITFRRVSEDDLPELARCMYHVYGYTYKEVVYRPEKMKEMIDAGVLASVIAVTPDGEIVAHQGLKKEKKDSPIAEITMGVVDPRFRGRRLFERIKAYSFDEVKEEGVYGLFTEMVANHPYSQKANLAMGAKETGVMLGFVPRERAFVALSDQEEGGENVSVIVGYTRLGPEPWREVYAPLRHETMIREIYEHGGFNRSVLAAGAPDSTPRPDHSLVDVKYLSDMKSTFLRVLSFGHDFEHLLRVRLREFCLGRYDCIYVDLPLSDPATRHNCAAVENMGFFFSGIIPELHDGDFLRFQYLNNITIDPRNVVTVTEFGRRLFDYVVRAWGVEGVGEASAADDGGPMPV